MAQLAGGASGHLPYTLISLIIQLLLVTTVSPGSIIGAIGRSTSQHKCVTHCKDSTKYGFRAGMRYRYTYRTDMRTFAAAAASEDSNLQLSSVVDLTAITPCEIQLELRDVRISESGRSEIENTAELVRELTQHPIRFSFQDGRLEHICTVEEDTLWVLNIKRGILSALQNTMDDLRKPVTLNERDVSGNCLTRYDLTSDTNNRIIKKFKQLQSCSGRQSHVSAIQSVPYTSNSPVQNAPLLTSTQECKQSIRNRELTNVECYEEHKFQPFQDGQSGVRTTVSQSLVFQSSRPSQALTPIDGEHRTHLLKFETPLDEEASDADIRELMSLLMTLERESLPKVTEFVPEKFLDLVQQLRTISYPALSSLFNKAPSSTARSLLLDAMPLVGSAPSLTLMQELYAEGKLSESQIDSWLTSITFIKHPRIEMISAIAPMLNGEPKNEALLSMASVIYAYCKDNHECNQEVPIQDALRKILSFLGTGCKFTQLGDKDFVRGIFALKAIGNAGRLPYDSDDRSFELLRKCFEESTNPIEVRLAAVDAFRRMPCDLYDHKPMIQLYANMKEQTEVRIMAYLMGMKCSDRGMVDAIKETLSTDAVNQVGSFVWTHLKNLQLTSSPDKQELRELLSNDFLQKKFNIDARKYSRNYERSMFWEDKNVGGGVEANVVFTPDSFLPRSTTLNLTLFLFGESINLMEVGGRIHSFEELLESVFGPEGYFPEPHVNEALNSVRSKRDTSNNKVERLGQVFHQAGLNRDRLPGGSVFMRIFGNEISYKRFELSHKQTAPSLVDENGKNWFDITYLFDNMGTGKSTEFTKSSILMDSSYTVPTAAGIQLTLGVQAATSVGMKANGKVDLENFWDNQEVDVQTELRPSGTIQVDGYLTLQLGKLSSNFKSGIKFQNKLHTATAIQTKVLVKGTNIAHASITLPQQKQEILEAKSQVILIFPTREEVLGQGSGKDSGDVFCSPEVLSKAVGLKLCGSVNVPGIKLPLLKPSSISLYLEKTDTFNSYEFDYKWVGDEAGDRQDLSFLFNTPGSTVDRRLAMAYSIDKIQGKLEASIETPCKAFTAQGLYSKTAKNLQLVLRSREEQILLVTTGLRKQNFRIEPHLLVSYYSNPLIDVQGVVHMANILSTDGKATLDLTVKHLTDSPIRLTGELARMRDVYDGRFGIESYLARGNIRSHLRIRPDIISSKAEIQYSWRGSEFRALNLGGKLQKLEKGGVTKYLALMTTTSQAFPYLNTQFSWETAKARGYCENNAKLVLGESIWVGKTLFKNQRRRQAHDLQLLFSLLGPSNSIDYHVDLHHHKNQSGLFTKFLGRTDSVNELKAEAKYLRTDEKLLRRNFDAQITWPGSLYSLKSGVTEVRSGNYEAQLVLLPNKGTPMKATATYKNGSTKRRLDHDIELRATDFLPVPLSYSAYLVASDRESKMGTQLQIEGRKRYSGKWGGTLQYSASKRFSHKIEAKVDINERNYSGELNWRQARSGDETYTADFYLSQHFHSELLLKRTNQPELFWGILTVVPDKTFRSQEKMTLEGKLSTDSAKVNADYFGEIMSLAGVYSSEKVQLEAEWDFKRLALSLDTPALTLERLKVVATLDTPFEGYRSLGLNIDHVYDANLVSFRAQGHLESKFGAFAIYGTTDSPQKIFSIMLDATDMEKLTGVAKMKVLGATKLLDITLGKGGRSSTLKMEIEELQRSSTIKIDFSGAHIIPHVYAEYSRLRTSEVTNNLVFQWTPERSEPRRIQARVTYLLSPMKASFLLTTPWKSFEKLEGHFSTFESPLNREMKFYINGPASALPINFEVRLGGWIEEFGHSVSASWYEQKSKRPKSISLAATGRLATIEDGQLKLSGKILDSSYELDMSSTQNLETGLRINTQLTYDEEQMEFGLGWLMEGIGKIETSVWAVYPNQPKMILSFKHVQNSGSYLLDFSCGQVGKAMENMKIDMKHDGWLEWAITASLDSPLNIFPTIQFSSQHDLKDWTESRHVTEYELKRISKLWGGFEDQNGSINFSIHNGHRIEGSFDFNKKYFQIHGEVDVESEHKYLHLTGVTPLLPEYKFGAGIDGGNYMGGEAYFNASRNGHTFYDARVQILLEHDIRTLKFHFNCPLGHLVEAEGTLNLAKREIEFTLKETKKELINLRFKGAVQGDQGKLELDLDGKAHPLLRKKHLEGHYRFQKEKVKVNGQYEDERGMSLIEGTAQFTQALKKVQLRMEGSKVLKYNFEVRNNQILEGIVGHDGRNLFQISGKYDNQAGEFLFGKHTIDLNVTTRNFYPFSTTFGLDMNKVLVQLSTPFEFCKEFMFEGELSLEDSTKSLSLRMKKDDTVYNGKVSSVLSPNRGKVEASLEIPWKGYSQSGYSVEYERKRDHLQGSIQGYVESSKIFLSGDWSPSQAKIELKTPYKTMQNALLKGEWDLKNPTKSILLSANLSGRSHVGQAQWNFNRKNGFGQLTLDGVESVKVELKYDFRTDYSTEASLSYSGTKHEIRSQFVIGPQEVRIQIQTPFSTLRNFDARGGYVKPSEGSHHLSLDWNLNGQKKSIRAETIFSGQSLSFTVHTPLSHPWNELEGKLGYETSSVSNKITLDARRGDNEKLSLLTEFGSRDVFDGDRNGDLVFKFELKSPFRGWERVKLETNYNRVEGTHTGGISLFKNVEFLKSSTTVVSTSKDGQEIAVKGSLILPQFRIQSETSVSMNVNSKGEVSVKAELTHNGVDYSCEGTFQLGSSSFKIRGRSSFSSVRNFFAMGNYGKFSDMSLILQLNEKIIDMKFQGAYDGLRHFKINTDISTPFEGYRALHGEAQVTLDERMSRGRFSFQNDHVRYMGKFNGQFGEDFGNIRIQFNSPIYRLENVVGSLKYGGSKALIRLERNTKEEIKIEASLRENQLIFGIVSNLPSYSVNMRSVLDWNHDPFLFQLNLDGTNPEEGIFINSKIDGFQDGNIEIQTPFKGYENISTEWMLEGNLENGLAKLSYNLPYYGKRAFRSAWKQSNFKSVEAELWWNENDSPDQGISGQYSWTSLKSGIVKFGGSLSYVKERMPQAVTLSLSVKQSDEAGASLIDFSLKTPFSSMEDLSLTGKVRMDRGISIDITSLLNKEKSLAFSSSLFVSPLNSRLKLIFNAPTICEPFNLNAFYDLTTSEKSVEVFFGQAKYKLNVKAQALVPIENPEEIELRMNVDSNIPSVTVSASASLRAGYKIENDGTRQVTLSVDSAHTRNWRLVAAVRPRSNFNVRIRLESPLPDVIPSIKSELGWERSAEGLVADFSHHMGTQDIRSRLTTGDEQFKLSLTSSFSGFNNVIIQGRLESGAGKMNRNFLVEIGVDGKRVTLTAKILIPSEVESAEGSIRLSSSWNMIPDAALEASLDQNGLLTVHGNWGQRTVSVRGNFRRKMELTLWEAAEADVTLWMDSREILTFQSHHIFHEPQYSWNVTVGNDWSFNSFLTQLGNKSKFSCMVKWSSQESISVSGETNKGRFRTSVETPWTNPMELSGQYKVGDNEYSADGFVTYDGIRSGLRAELITKRDSMAAQMSVDVPALGQKVDANIYLEMTEHDYVVGQLELSMGDRHVSVKGSLANTHYTSTEFGSMVEQDLKMSISLPRSDYGEVSSIWKISRIENAWEHAEIEGSVVFAGETHKVAIRYDIPTETNARIGLDWYLNSPLLSREVLKGAFQADKLSMSNFRGGLRYRENEFKVSWSFGQNFMIDGSVDLPNTLHESSPLRIQVEGVFNFPSEISLRTTVSADKDSSTFEASLARLDHIFNIRLFCDGLPLHAHSEGIEIRFKIHNLDGEKAVIDVFGSYGQETFSAIGELVSSSSTTSASVKVLGSYGSHFGQLAWGKMHGQYYVELNGESLNLFKGKKLSVIGSLSPTNTGIDASIECRTKNAVHGIKVSVELGRERGALLAKVDSPFFDQMLLDVTYVLNADRIEAKVGVNLMDLHQIQILVSRRDREAKLFIHCPIFTSEPISVHIKGMTNENDVSFIGDVDVFRSRFRGEGTFRFKNLRDIEMKLEIITPFESLDRITVEGAIGEEAVGIEFYTPIKELPNFIFKLSGIEIFETYSFENFHPKMTVGLPFVNYATEVSFQLPSEMSPGKVGAMFEQTFPNEETERYEVDLNISPYSHFRLLSLESPMEIKLEAKSPIQGFRHFVFLISGSGTGNGVWKTTADLVAKVKYNDKSISLISHLKNRFGNRKLSIDFITPFKDYDRFSLLAQIQNYEEIGAGHNIEIEFRQPGWNKPFTTEIDYRVRYNDLTDMDGEFKLAFPTMRMEPISFHMRSEAKEGKYLGIVEGKCGDHRPVLKLEASATSESLMASIEGKIGARNEYQILLRMDTLLQHKRFSFLTEMALNYEQIFLFSTGIGRERTLFEGEFRLKTPFEMIRSASAVYRLSPSSKYALTLENVLKNLDITAGASYNDRKLIHIELVNRKGKRSFEIHNPLRPVSIALSYDVSLHKKVFIVAEVCWDLTKSEESTLGVRFNLDQATRDAKALNFKIHGGKYGFVEVDLAKLNTLRNSEQRVNFKWNQPQTHGEGECGYEFLWRDESKLNLKKENMKFRLDMPWRSVEIETQAMSSNKEESKSFLLRWDLKRDPLKEVGAKLMSLRSVAWRRSSVKNVLTLIHSGLPHDLTFRLERRYKNFVLKALSFAFQPSPFPQDTFSMELMRDSLKNKEIRLRLAHPATNIDFIFHLKRMDPTTSLFLSHMDIEGEKHVLNVEVTSDAQGSLLDASTATGPLIQWEYKPSTTQPKLFMKTPSMEVSGEYISGLPLLKGFLKYDSDREISLLAGLPHKREIALKFDRVKFGMNIRDCFVTFRLNTSQILSTHIHWRRETADELRRFVTSDLPRWIKRVFQDDFPNALLVINDEIEKRLAVIDPSLVKFFSALQTYSRDEIKMIGMEANKIFAYLQLLHHNNTFYTKEVAVLIKSVLMDAYSKSSITVDTLRGMVSAAVRMLKSGVKMLTKLWEEKGGRLEDAVMALWDSAEEKAVDLWKEGAQNFLKFVKNMGQTYETIGEILDGNLEELERKVKGLGIVKRGREIYNNYITWIKDHPMQEYIEEAIHIFKEKIWRPLEIMYKPYFDGLNSVLEEQNFASLLELPPLPYLRFVSTRVLGFANRFWVFVEVEQKVKGLMRNILNRVNAIIQRHIPTATMIWDLDKGHIEYHQPLTFIEWNSFYEAPRFKETEVDNVQMLQVQDFYHDLLDTIRNTSPFLNLDLRYILPPFGATAIMAGNHHYLTFDQRYYHFVGECSYVLLSDLLNKNFTLLVNYEKRRGTPKKKSYTLMTGSSQIDIDAITMAVTRNGRITDLPFSIGSTFLRRQPSGLEIIDRRGFQMKCIKEQNVCTVSVSGWYFGKLGGLLGNYDNEISNDFRTPDGQVVSEVANFAHSWRVGERSGLCAMKNYAEMPVPEMNVEEDICDELMVLPSSPFRPCFKTVNVEVYRKMCRYDLQYGKGNREGRICSAAGAYVMQCQREGVDIWMPQQCVKCKLEGGAEIKSGENATFKMDSVRPPSSADIVFLIEEARSLRDYNLFDSIRKLEAALRTEGIQHNRYAIIGYGGKGPLRKPHIRTSYNKVWSPATSLKIPERSRMDGTGNGDLYEAMEYAAQLGYRAGVSKTMIAVMSNKDGCENNHRYSDSLTMLIENDIRLHILTPEDFSMKVERKQQEGRKIFGVDVEGAFTARQVKRGPMESDKALRRQVKMPKDLCTPLAMETTGSLFNLKMLARPAMAKKFVDVWSRRVASSSKPSDCQICECLPNRDGGATTLCQPCISPNLQKFSDDWNKLGESLDSESGSDEGIWEN